MQSGNVIVFVCILSGLASCAHSQYDFQPPLLPHNWHRGECFAFSILHFVHNFVLNARCWAAQIVLMSQLSNHFSLAIFRSYFYM